MNILEINNIGKSYKTYSGELWRILSWFGIKHKVHHEVWTLQNINFSIVPGEAVGIIGQNGAGKSTLLKIVTGTLKPTTGNITVRGKVAAILELGMGFHPDLTGRQNVYHSAGLMGYTQKEIDIVMGDIEAFAEIGEYFDYPVRSFSSGMQMRIAFAVATAYRPEILIVDEALSVGDVYFQHKSFDRIHQFRNEGTSLLFVSHDKSAILGLCSRAILLEKGNVIKDGDPEETMDYYNALIAEKENTSIRQEKLEDGKVQTISGSGKATVQEIGLYNAIGNKVEIIGVGDLVELRVRIKIQEDIPSLVLGYGIKDRLGQVMYGTNTWHTKQIIDSPKKGEMYDFFIVFSANFGAGNYSIQTALHADETHLSANYEWRDLAVIFSMVNISHHHFDGCVWNQPNIKLEKIK